MSQYPNSVRRNSFMRWKYAINQLKAQILKHVWFSNWTGCKVHRAITNVFSFHQRFLGYFWYISVFWQPEKNIMEKYSHKIATGRIRQIWHTDRIDKMEWYKIYLPRWQVSEKCKSGLPSIASSAEYCQIRTDHQRFFI